MYFQEGRGIILFPTQEVYTPQQQFYRNSNFQQVSSQTPTGPPPTPPSAPSGSRTPQPPPPISLWACSLCPARTPASTSASPSLRNTCSTPVVPPLVSDLSPEPCPTPVPAVLSSNSGSSPNPRHWPARKAPTNRRRAPSESRRRLGTTTWRLSRKRWRNSSCGRRRRRTGNRSGRSRRGTCSCGRRRRRTGNLQVEVVGEETDISYYRRRRSTNRGSCTSLRVESEGTEGWELCGWILKTTYRSRCRGDVAEVAGAGFLFVQDAVSASRLVVSGGLGGGSSTPGRTFTTTTRVLPYDPTKSNVLKSRFFAVLVPPARAG